MEGTNVSEGNTVGIVFQGSGLIGGGGRAGRSNKEKKKKNTKETRI